jgi:two-component system NarL family sensor kinase
VLNVASPGWRELSAGDLRLLYTVGDLLAIAVERARLFARQADFGAAEERNRLAREIHDTLAQGLTAITLQLETADALLEAQDAPERSRQAIAQALSLARSNLEEARRSVLDLRAAPLQDHTLSQALSALAAEWSAKGQAPVRFHSAGGSRPLPPNVEAGLYRIAQEALTNAARHGHASIIRLELAAEPGQVRLTVEDDGRGFEPDQITADRFGLLGLNERARLLGGSLSLQSSPGEGTRVEVTVPLDQPHA